MCCSDRQTRKLLRRYLKDKCQSISHAALCDLQDAFHEFQHQVLNGLRIKARRRFEPVHLAAVIEESFPCNKPLLEFAQEIRKRTQRRALRRLRDDEEETQDPPTRPEDSGGASD
jgi:hypothetical protein